MIEDLANQQAYLELPFIAGGNLREWVTGSDQDGPRLQPSTTDRVMIELMRALVYVHSNGIVHLDVKPDNILVTEDGTAKLSDFDVSKDTTARTLAAQSTRTMSAMAGGTLGYAAPEVLSTQPAGSNHPGPTTAADIWSAGSVFFFLQFHPKELTVLTATEPLEEVPSTCEAGRRELLEKMFREDPRTRPAADEVLAVLERQRQAALQLQQSAVRQKQRAAASERVELDKQRERLEPIRKMLSTAAPAYVMGSSISTQW